MHKIRKSYEGQVDLFAAYSPYNDKVYLLRLRETTKSCTRLRVDPAKNKQQSGIRNAERYEIDVVWNHLSLEHPLHDETAFSLENRDLLVLKEGEPMRACEAGALTI